MGGALETGMKRDAELQDFVTAAGEAFARFAPLQKPAEVSDAIFKALAKVAGPGQLAPLRLPVCDLLEPAMRPVGQVPELLPLVEAFRRIAPRLHWKQRADSTGTASGNFAANHANAMIIGPGGLEQRDDIWLGVTLMAPAIRYPDHDHAPEEVYLVLSDGEFSQADGAWFTPGIGGSFYNEPGIKHAMRSTGQSLFAFWVLRA